MSVSETGERFILAILWIFVTLNLAIWVLAGNVFGLGVGLALIGGLWESRGEQTCH